MMSVHSAMTNVISVSYYCYYFQFPKFLLFVVCLSQIGTYCQACRCTLRLGQDARALVKSQLTVSAYGTTLSCSVGFHLLLCSEWSCKGQRGERLWCPSRGLSHQVCGWDIRFVNGVSWGQLICSCRDLYHWME